MKECRWLQSVLVAQFEFVEWTPDGHLRHSRFVALKEEKDRGRCARRKSEFQVSARLRADMEVVADLERKAG